MFILLPFLLLHTVGPHMPRPTLFASDDHLSVEEVTTWDLPTRARAIQDLSRGHTSTTDEATIRDILLATSGPDLTALKNMLDGTGDTHDLLDLLFHTVDDREIRREILDHFTAEAARAPGDRKILSDIDDTFYANLKDKSLPHPTVYPGVRAFYRALDRGPAPTPGREGDLTFLTARPGLMKARTLRTLQGHGLRPVVVSGDLAHLLSPGAMADAKWKNFARLRDVFPEYTFVWVGDSGQGDVRLGERMRAECPSVVVAVFIHDVPSTGAETRQAHAANGIHFFDTYVGAAVVALDLGLISPERLREVVQESLFELEQIVFDDPAQGEERHAALLRDVALAHTRLSPP